MKKIVLVTVLIISFLCACADEDKALSKEESKVLSGTVLSSEFTAKGGRAFVFDDKITIQITDAEDFGCEDYGGGNKYISIHFNVPHKNGTYKNVPLSFFKNEGKEETVNATVKLKIVKNKLELTLIAENKSISIKGHYSLLTCSKPS